MVGRGGRDTFLYTGELSEGIALAHCAVILSRRSKINAIKSKIDMGAEENRDIIKIKKIEPKGTIRMKIAVVDDCREDAYNIKNMLCGHEVSLYFDAKSLLADVDQKENAYDLYLLDIYIEGAMSGIELAQKLRLSAEETAICFISTSGDFYREAYDLYAVQYLIKPVRQEALMQLLNRISKSLVRDEERSLSFTWRKAAGSISYGKILYISSMGKTLSIHCKDGTVQKCTGKLNELELHLDNRVFCRCHQSFLVNMYKVENLSGTELMISNIPVPVSRRYYPEVKRRYQKILFEGVE